MKKQHNYCVILAGGIGKRLWPCSTKKCPKQFIDFFGTGQTLLQQTYERVSRFILPQNIYVSTFIDYADLVAEQLPNMSKGNILAEPVRLSTAPAVTWASYHIGIHDAGANIFVVPCDQLILDEKRFAEEVEDGLDFVENNKVFLAMGVKATQPNTAYGYIQIGHEESEGLYTVKSFMEKPNESFAKMFVESGEFLWNTGLFAWNFQTMRSLLHEIMPQVEETLSQLKDISLEEELNLVKHYYSMNMHRSIDLIVLERKKNVFVKECFFGWADLGNWPDMRAAEKKDVDGNAVVGHNTVMFSGSQNNVVCLPEKMTAVVQGLDGFLVAMNNNILVICPDNDPALVRRLFNEVQFTLGDEYV